MVYGNPNCYTYAQSCSAGCCNIYGECPSYYDYTCYYYYYNYGTSLTSSLSRTASIGIGVGIGVFVLLAIAFGVCCYYRRRRALIGMGLGGTQTTTVVMTGGPGIAGPQFGNPMMMNSPTFVPPPPMPNQSISMGIGMGMTSPNGMMSMQTNNVVLGNNSPNGGFNPWQQANSNYQGMTYDPSNPLSQNF